METEKSFANSEELQEFDINKLRPVASKSSSRENTEVGIISIINSVKNGKRISLSKGLMQKLNCPKTIQFSFYDESIAIAENLPNNKGSFTIKEWKKQFLIYSAPLVNEITRTFDLDFEGITSKTFHEARYMNIEETTVAMISMK